MLGCGATKMASRCRMGLMALWRWALRPICILVLRARCIRSRLSGMQTCLHVACRPRHPFTEAHHLFMFALSIFML